MSEITLFKPYKYWGLLSTVTSLKSEVRRSFICKRQVAHLLKAVWKH